MEKRNLRRIPVSLDASLDFDGVSCDAFIGNISENGLYTVVTDPQNAGLQLQQETDVLLSFHSPAGEIIKLHCIKKWSNQSSNHDRTTRLGLELLDASPVYTSFYQNKYYEIRNDISRNSIAVIGMACYYPGAPDLSRFWENILARRREFRKIPDVRMPLSEYYDPDPATPDKTYGTKAAVIDGFIFDWAKRGIPKSVIESSDIAHWLALEISLGALEDAGYSRKTVPSDRSGVILGNTLTGEHSRSENMRLRWPYVRKALIAAASQKGMPSHMIDELAESMEGYYKSAFAPVTEDTLAGNLSNTIAGRICNFLNFNGGGYTVDGACSSSLIAVTTAASALSNGNMDLVIAGGVDISLDTFELVGFAKTNALTREDMRVYDRSASGFIPGEGAGFVVLKRLEDARADGNYIYATLRGWGMSSDGKGGMTAPKAETQAIAIRRAYTQAGYTLHDVDFIEGHGTGTPAGDKAELEAIADAMQGGAEMPLRSCGITSLKSIIGHTKAASGIGGFIKAALAVNRRVLPPTAACSERNVIFDQKALSVYPILHGEVRSPEDVLRAGVSGMGFGGINCHVTLESGYEPAEKLKPAIAERKLLASPQETELFVFSADSVEKLVKRIRATALIADGISMGEMVDLAKHLAAAAAHQDNVRASIIASTPQDLLDALRRCEEMLLEKGDRQGQILGSSQQDIWIGNGVKRNRVGYLFPGQGSQQLNMGRILVERHSWARDLIEQADGWLPEPGAQAVSAAIYKPVDRVPGAEQTKKWREELTRSEIAQPAICLSSLLWLNYLQRLGISPTVTGGHSLGELMAVHAAGVIDAKELLGLAALRGQAMAVRTNGDSPGTMAGFSCDRKTLEDIISQVEGYAVVANINSPSQTVLSGEASAVEKATLLAAQKDIQTKILPVANAFHSRFVNDAAERLRKEALIPEKVEKTGVRLLSSIDGAEIQPGTDLRDHFARQVTSQVDFISLTENMKTECDLMLEVGPGRVLTGLVQATTGPTGHLCFPVEAKAAEERSLNTFLGAYFVHGGEIRWPVLYENRLVRPFVPPSKRLFIDNPCERPLVSAKGEPEPNRYSDFAFGNAVTETADSLGLFSSQQINFIQNLISSELKRNPAVSDKSAETLLPGPANVIPISSLPIQENASRPPLDQGKSPDVLLELVSEMTGFPLESISLEKRLLDDLNLDSIKAGQFVAKAVKLFGVEGKLDPTTMANSSLQEIYQAIAQVAPAAAQVSAVPALPQADPGLLLELASQMTGFPLESISLEKRLLDDLNLDSIKAGQFVARAVKLFGVEGQLDPTTMANNSIQEIYEKIRDQLPAAPVPSEPLLTPPGQPETATLSSSDRQDNWVRNFIITYKDQELTPPAPVADTLSRLSAENKEVFIFTDEPEGQLPQNIKAVLSEHRINFAIKEYEQIEAMNLQDNNDIAACIYLPPVHDTREIPSAEQVRIMTRRLHGIGCVITALKGKSPKTAHAVVQFGAGEIFNVSGGDSAWISKGSAAFLSSLHFDNPGEKIRLLELDSRIDAAGLLHRITAELAADEPFGLAGYDRNNVRRIPMLEPAESRAFQKRAIHWSHDDVLLVTGGAKGITAECALSFARETGAKLALVGRTVFMHNNTEMQQIFKRYRENNITYRYYACDISDATSVQDLVARIEQDLGPVTGVIHGAAVNKPRRAEQASLESVLDEVSPKLLGAINICNTLRVKPPKLFIGLSSIIGVTGMMGNGWYGFSNEAMDLLLQEFAATTDKTEVISLAYSIWGETGMGARMGSVNTLQSMGILPIPTKGGVERFMQLVMNDPGEHQVVVSSRLAGLNTPMKHAIPNLEDARFLEDILYYEKGVELEAKVLLTLEKDPYLKHHLFNSTYLFPTVFGLEAMAQAVTHVTGVQAIDHVTLEDVRLSYPITVSPDDLTEIHIYALVNELAGKDEAIRVKVGITVDQTGFKKNHFEATFVLDTLAPREIYEEAFPETVLDILPQEDLYGHMLFQGEMFQQIQSVRLLEEDRCSFDSAEQSQTEATDTIMPKFYCGDPFFRDTLLQSIQIFLPDVTALPVEIEKWEIFRCNGGENKIHTVEARLLERTPDMLAGEVVACDEKGRVVEKLHGYKAKIIENKKNAPGIHDLLAPDAWDEELLNGILQSYGKKLNVTPPVIAVRHQSGFHGLDKEQRRNIENDLFIRAYGKLKPGNPILPDDITVAWTEQSKPIIRGNDDIGISCSHEDRLCVCSVGRQNQGIDIETINQRNEQEWRELLCLTREPLLEECTNLDTSVDHAGTRIWCALETLRKATNMEENDLELVDKIDECIIFRGGAVTILTLPVKLLRGRERILAFTATNEENLKEHERQTEDGKILRASIPWESFIYDDRLERKVFTCQLPISLRDNATIGGGVYFANYLHWLGKVREMSLRPIGEYIADEFYNGHFMVTNHSKVDVVGEVRNHDDLEARLWIDRVSGDRNSTLLLKCEWRKRLSHGDTKTVAYGEQQTTWVRVVGHGIVEPVDCPHFFQNYMEESGIMPINNSTPIAPMGVDHENANLSGLGELKHETTAGINGTASLSAMAFDTSMENSNLAQNIYFSNYFIWQGHVRDRFFFDISPEQYRQMNGNGQLLCLNSSVKHLREAMPFDRILATMYLKKLYECGLDLYFDYHKIAPSGEKEKIAFGDHTLAWVHVDPNGNFKPRNLPQLYTDTMLNLHGVGHG